MWTEPPILWLVVENDDDDALLMRRAFRRLTRPVRVHWAKDGREAMSYLAGEGAFGDRTAFPLPTLIISDLKMPKVTGLELLSWSKGQDRTCHIPFVLLTNSSLLADRDRAHALGAHDYLVKPTQFDDLLKLLSELSGRFPDESSNRQGL